MLIGYVFEELEKEGIETELIQIGGQNVMGCIACMKCAENQDRKCILSADPVNDRIARMDEADGVILASPTYFTDVTAEMKALIDRAGFVAKVNGDMLSRKVGCAVVAVRRAGPVHAYDTMNHFFGISQMIIPGSSYWNLGVGLAAGDVSTDEEGIMTMRNLGRNMAWLLKKIND